MSTTPTILGIGSMLRYFFQFSHNPETRLKTGILVSFKKKMKNIFIFFERFFNYSRLTLWLLSVCFSLVCVLKAQEHRRNAVFLFGLISLKSSLQISRNPKVQERLKIDPGKVLKNKFVFFEHFPNYPRLTLWLLSVCFSFSLFLSRTP